MVGPRPLIGRLKFIFLPDSGSLIVNDDLQAVALLFAGGDQGGTNGQGLTFAKPIAKVFDALAIDLLT